jgi:uncharacterized RDD family membrane protein YckC
LWRRLAAGVYDLLPLAGITFFAGALALALTGGELDPHRTAHKLLTQALVLFLDGGYFVLSWLRGGQTLGGRAWRVRVVPSDGAALGLRQALLRFAVAVVSLLAFGAGFWWALADRDRRTWHDRVARTMVIET